MRDESQKSARSRYPARNRSSLALCTCEAYCHWTMKSIAGFRKVVIEMLVPDDLDSSDLLERMQTLSAEIAEEFSDDDELDGTGAIDTVIDVCSVCEVDA